MQLTPEEEHSRFFDDTRERGESHPAPCSDEFCSFPGTTIFGCSSDERSTIVLSIRICPVSSYAASGSTARSEYDPFRLLNGETWKSFDHVSEKTKCLPFLSFFSSVAALSARSKYIRLSSNVLLTSSIMYLSAVSECCHQVGVCIVTHVADAALHSDRHTHQKV
ncbi:hypothetical protein KC362_g69 [Hortaea werneckii]|nr:hypothetical protein KC362_g69 [Hortaea werneckii]